MVKVCCLIGIVSSSLPGVKKALGQYGPAGVADTTSAGGNAGGDDEDDDIDLFGSDEEEVCHLFTLGLVHRTTGKMMFHTIFRLKL